MPKLDPPSISAIIRELMAPHGLSQSAMARAAGFPLGRLNQILIGHRGISADTDLRLCRLFGLTDGYFLRWQVDQELAKARVHLGSALNRVKPLPTAC